MASHKETVTYLSLIHDKFFSEFAIPFRRPVLGLLVALYLIVEEDMCGCGLDRIKERYVIS